MPCRRPLLLRTVMLHTTQKANPLLLSTSSRPKSLDDVTAQDHTVTVLRRTLQSANLPHMSVPSSTHISPSYHNPPSI